MCELAFFYLKAALPAAIGLLVARLGGGAFLKGQSCDPARVAAKASKSAPSRGAPSPCKPGGAFSCILITCTRRIPGLLLGVRSELGR